MLNKVLLQPAYILHSRLYRDTSLLLEFFTPDYGRVSLLARGVRGQRGRFKGILQPFVPLLISWSGKTELMTLTNAETCDLPHQFTGDILLCGIYLNELLMKLLHRYDPHSELYRVYETTLRQLPQDQMAALRYFEKALLSELGYALQIDREANTNLALDPELFYFFDPAQGVFVCHNPEQQNNVFSGKALLAIHESNWSDPTTFREAKRLLRIALTHLLNGKPIRSRELFV
jgi:DNA repair protein RecO (recombination protein O)